MNPEDEVGVSKRRESERDEEEEQVAIEEGRGRMEKRDMRKAAAPARAWLTNPR